MYMLQNAEVRCSHVVGLANSPMKKKGGDFPKQSSVKESKALCSCLVYVLKTAM